MTTVLTEDRRTGEFLVSEANGYRSREKGILAQVEDGIYSPGQIFGRTLVGAVAAAVATAGNAGNGVMGAITVTGPAQNGVYLLTFIEPVTNLGTFIVTGPEGNQVGTGKVGTAFAAGGLGFTLADGANDFAAGDTFTITVTGGTEKYGLWNTSNTNGTQVAAAILYAAADVNEADKVVTLIVRDAEVNGLVMPGYGDVGDEYQALARAQLGKHGIIFRS
jgi:hypothetical protein